ncbi:DUF1329 domain-containing protein [Myxococcota bacterium]|nr:DUF1329 domain-containing protein [Myxococcota bacterium]
MQIGFCFIAASCSRCLPKILLRFLTVVGLLMFGSPQVTYGQESVTGFKEGDILGFDRVDLLKPYLPQEFWAHRHFFFFEGMELEIGPGFRDYSNPPEWKSVTERFKGQARIGPGGSLENYTAGEPFPMAEIDCFGDPLAGYKVIWNFDLQWSGDGARSNFLYTYFDRGEQLTLYYQGQAKVIQMTGRIEPYYLGKNGGDIFKDDPKKTVMGIEVKEPFAARGLSALSYRYKASQNPPEQIRYDDTWIYQPDARRVRRFSTKERADAISGTDFSFDDLRSFAGIVPHYTWSCLGEVVLIAPMNTQKRAYPYSKDVDFGPFGLSYANDRWELRHAILVSSVPNDPEHPYSRKDIYIDKQTLTPLYSFAYDRKGELWKIIWHNHRWSEDDSEWYKSWPGIDRPRDMRIVSDTIANAQTGTGNRIEFWDSHGTPFDNKAKVRRYIDIGRLSQGR